VSEAALDLLIAIVDDDASVGRSLARFLKASGFRSVIYPSAEAFLVDTPRPHIDCLITDLQLGGMSGVELRERLRSSGESIPMILMTAHDERELDESAWQAHDAALLRKSASGTVVLETVRRMTAILMQETGSRVDKAPKSPSC